MIQKRKCPRCGGEITIKDQVCPSCGAQLRLKKRYLVGIMALALFLVAPLAVVFVVSRFIVSHDPSISQAEQFVTVLENYKKDNAVYPCNVKELIPEYLLVKPDRLTWYKCDNEKKSYHFFVKCDSGIMTRCKATYEGRGV